MVFRSGLSVLVSRVAKISFKITDLTEESQKPIKIYFKLKINSDRKTRRLKLPKPVKGGVSFWFECSGFTCCQNKFQKKLQLESTES